MMVQTSAINLERLGNVLQFLNHSQKRTATIVWLVYRNGEKKQSGALPV
jgi:hypothetical protein